MGSTTHPTIPALKNFNWQPLRKDVAITGQVYYDGRDTWVRTPKGSLQTTSGIRKSVCVVSKTCIHNSVYALRAFGLITEEELYAYEEHHERQRLADDALLQVLRDALNYDEMQLKLTAAQKKKLLKVAQQVTYLDSYTRQRVEEYEKETGTKLVGGWTKV